MWDVRVALWCKVSNRFDQRIRILSYACHTFKSFLFLCARLALVFVHVCCVRYLSYNCNQFFAFHFWGSSNSCKCKYLNASIRFLHPSLSLAPPPPNFVSVFMRLRIFNNIYLFNVTCSCANICVSKSFSNRTAANRSESASILCKATKSLYQNVDYALIASM